jgi:probable F420-dependent oxidoreductase
VPLRYGVVLPQAGRYVKPELQRRLATEVEAMGYDSLWVSDHVIVPVGEGYIPEVMLEPLALLAWLASCTSTITLGTSVLILPYRDPVFTAKFTSTVDVLSGGRVVLGVGAGWMEKEFDALSASFAERGAVTDEYLRVIRNLWETDTSTFEGRWKRYENMRMFPKAATARTSTIPIVVGGNAPVSIRRAAELGDGWHPINLSPAQLAEGVARYRAACADHGRQPGPVILRHMNAKPLDALAGDIAAYEDAGLDELILSIGAPSADELVQTLESFRQRVG